MQVSSSPTSEWILSTNPAVSCNWECVEGEDLLGSFHSETEPLGQDCLKTVAFSPALRPTEKLPLAQMGRRQMRSTAENTSLKITT